MSAPPGGTAAPAPWRPESQPSAADLNFQALAVSKTTQASPGTLLVPQEFLVGLTSTVSSKTSPGQDAHHRHCEGCGIRRPDAVWHHPLGRKKYRHFLEQPTSMTGAGSDISFLCDARVNQKKTLPLPPVTEKNEVSEEQNLTVAESLFPEEYCIVKNKGIQSLEFYEDAFTVQLKDDEQKLRVLPSLRPSGRLEVVQLTKMMDDMLEKAGVDQWTEELTEFSQLEGLLELVKVEQNIYNVVFHELIRQVSVGCAERGQLLAKLRQRYQSLLDRIPHRLKALHSEAVAQRSLIRRLIEEIQRIRASSQQLNMELSRIREHDAFVSQQAELAHRQLAESLKQTHTNTDVVQGYHQLYELLRARLETQLLQMTEDRDVWSRVTFCLALKVIATKKLELVSRLHISEQNWHKTAENCVLYITSKDKEDLRVVMSSADYWRAQLTAFMSRMDEGERDQCAQVSVLQQGIIKWRSFIATQQNLPSPKYDRQSVEEVHADLESWSKILALQCERYQGEEQFCCQQTLKELGSVQENWLKKSFQLFRRHPSPDGGEPARGRRALEELERAASELLKLLDTRVSGESGIYDKMTTLIGSLKSWVSKTDAEVGRPEKMPLSEWTKLETALQDWQSLSEGILQHISVPDTDNEMDKNKPHIYLETEKLFDRVQDFRNNLSSFTEGENQSLQQEVSSLHVAQTRWMLDLLILMVPEHSDDQILQQEYKTQISPLTLDLEAKVLAEKQDSLSGSISSSCKVNLEELGPCEEECEDVMNECTKLQNESVAWAETCMLLLSGLKAVSIQRSEPTDSTDLARATDTVKDAASDGEVKDIKEEAEAEPKEGEPSVCESVVVKLIDFDGNLTQKTLKESSVHLNGADELLVSPATEDARRAFSDLTTVVVLQQELHDSEVRANVAERRALKAEEELQEALVRIRDLERQLHGPPSLEPKSNEGKEKTPPPSTPTAATPAPPKKCSAEPKPTSSSKKTRKR